MSQTEKARRFADLHVPGTPLILYNIWDAGGARAIAKAGAQAVATGSWSVAAAQGYRDGQDMPLDFVLQIVERIAASVDVPLTVDFEGGYAAEPEGVAANVGRLVAAGAIGLNFEDQVVGGEGLYATEDQCARIVAARGSAPDLPLFVNARTDLFLKEKDPERHAGLVAEAKERAAAYAEAGASSFFVPGLIDPDLIAEVCAGVGLPVNIMMRDGAPSPAQLAAAGVARISHGPRPYVHAMSDVVSRFQEATATG